MKISKRSIILLSLLMATLIFATACGQQGKEDVEEVKDKIEEEAEDVKDKVDEKVEELTDKDKSERTKMDVMLLVEEIVAEDLENVKVVDFEKVDTREENPEELYIADIKLFIDVDDKAEAESLMETYNKIIFDKLYDKYKYEEVILMWTSPNHDDANLVEGISYKG